MNGNRLFEFPDIKELIKTVLSAKLRVLTVRDEVLQYLSLGRNRIIGPLFNTPMPDTG